MRDYKKELENRVAFVREMLANAHAKGIIFGNSGGKDSALVGIICKAACENTVGVIMPCASRINYGKDKDDGNALCSRFGIECRVVDLTETRNALVKALSVSGTEADGLALANIAPRLRMNALYAIAAKEGRIVAGTGNRSESYMGYFTKYGDGGYDFNVIKDLTVREVYEFLEYLGAPESIRKKAPSAGLYEGQTDEKEMGISYDAIDDYLLYGKVTPENREIIERYHTRSLHKGKMPPFYNE